MNLICTVPFLKKDASKYLKSMSLKFSRRSALAQALPTSSRTPARLSFK